MVDEVKGFFQVNGHRCSCSAFVNVGNYLVNEFNQVVNRGASLGVTELPRVDFGPNVVPDVFSDNLFQDFAWDSSFGDRSELIQTTEYRFLGDRGHMSGFPWGWKGTML